MYRSKFPCGRMKLYPHTYINTFWVLLPKIKNKMQKWISTLFATVHQRALWASQKVIWKVVQVRRRYFFSVELHKRICLGRTIRTTTCLFYNGLRSLLFIKLIKTYFYFFHFLYSIFKIVDDFFDILLNIRDLKEISIAIRYCYS